MNKTKTNIFIALLSASYFLCGCSTDFVSPSNPYDYGLLKKDQKKANKIVPALEKEYYAVGTSSDRQTQIREQSVAILVQLDDEYYRKWISDFYGRGQAFNTITEVAAPIFSAASALETGGAAQALAIISTGIGALNVSVNKNFLQQTAISLLTARTDALRTTIRAKINSNMSNSISVYHLYQAMQDVQDYALAGSLPQAAQAIAGDTSALKASAQAGTPAGSKAGPVSATKTSVTSSLSSIKSDGHSSSTITITAVDANGVKETASCGPVTLQSSIGTLTPVAPTDNGNGTYTTILTSSASGSATITGSIGGNPIGVVCTVAVTP